MCDIRRQSAEREKERGLESVEAKMCGIDSVSTVRIMAGVRGDGVDMKKQSKPKKKWTSNEAKRRCL